MLPERAASAARAGPRTGPRAAAGRVAGVTAGGATGRRCPFSRASAPSTSAAACALGHLGQVWFYEGGFEKAEAMFEESLALNLAVGDTRNPVVALAQNYLAEIALHRR